MSSFSVSAKKTTENNLGITVELYSVYYRYLYRLSQPGYIIAISTEAKTEVDPIWLASSLENL